MTMTLNRTRPNLATWTPPVVQYAVARQGSFHPTRLPRVLWALSSTRVDDAAARVSAALSLDVSYDELVEACKRGCVVTALGNTIYARPDSQAGAFRILVGAS